MDDTKNTYCRLCAESKPHSQLNNLQYDEETYNKIVKSLARFDIEVNLNVNILPRTVCFVCIKSLEQAFDFVTAVEQAQITIMDFVLVQPIKRDESDLGEGNVFYEPPCVDVEDDINVKHEVDEDPGEYNECGFSTKCERKLTETPEISNVDEIKYEVIANEQPDIIDKRDINIREKNIGDENSGDDDNNIGTEKDLNSSLCPEKTNESLINKKINRLATVPLSSIKKTWADYSWKCSECATQFQDIEALRKHSIQYHKNCNLFGCIDCKRKVLRLNGFLKHVRSHRKYLHYSCYICYTKFSNLSDATKHYKLTHMKSPYICPGCNTNFSTGDELDEHISAFYKKSILKTIIPAHWQTDGLTCKVCKKTFTYRSGFYKHMLVHIGRTRDYICEQCGRSFFERVFLEKHMIVHTDVKPYQCEVCKLSFRDIYQLRYHLTIHSGEKPFACDQCGRRFRLKSQIKQHFVTHTDSLPHVCTVCNRRFRLKSTLNQHVRQHTGEKPFSCDICQRDFTDRGNCNKHMKRIHGIDKSKKKRSLDGIDAVDPVVTVTDKVTKRKKEIMESPKQKNTIGPRKNKKKQS